MNYSIDEQYAWKIPSKPLNLPDIPLVNDDEHLYYHFYLKKIDVEKFIQGNPFFEWLAENYKFSCGLIKMERNKVYDWHIDVGKTKTNRGVCINALVTPSPSFVLFTDNLNNLMSHGGEEFQTDIVPFTYELNEIYLFNTTKAHSVYNFEKERLLFSVEFELDYPLLTYERIKDKIKTEFLNEQN